MEARNRNLQVFDLLILLCIEYVLLEIRSVKPVLKRTHRYICAIDVVHYLVAG